MNGGRTQWWPHDVALHRRENEVELRQEFGPAAIALADVLRCWAQEQGATGVIRGGFLSLALETAVEVAVIRVYFEYAARIGSLDDVEIDDDGRRFTCRISGFTADGSRGRAAARKQEQREREEAEAKAAEAIRPQTVDSDRDKSRSVTLSAPQDLDLTEQDQTTDSLRSSAARSPASDQDDPLPKDFPEHLKPVLADVLPVLKRCAAGRKAMVVSITATAAAIAAFPDRPHLDAAKDLDRWLNSSRGQGARPRDIVALYRKQLDQLWWDVEPEQLAKRDEARKSPWEWAEELLPGVDEAKALHAVRGAMSLRSLRPGLSLRAAILAGLEQWYSDLLEEARTNQKGAAEAAA